MNRIIKFDVINHAEPAAGLNRSESDVEVRLDWYNDDSLPEVVESFRQVLQELYDTRDVATDEERDDQYRKENAQCEPCPDCGGVGQHSYACTPSRVVGS